MLFTACYCCLHHYHYKPFFAACVCPSYTIEHSFVWQAIQATVLGSDCHCWGKHSTENDDASLYKSPLLKDTGESAVSDRRSVCVYVIQAFFPLICISDSVIHRNSVQYIRKQEYTKTTRETLTFQLKNKNLTKLFVQFFQRIVNVNILLLLR